MTGFTESIHAWLISSVFKKRTSNNHCATPFRFCVSLILVAMLGGCSHFISSHLQEISDQTVRSLSINGNWQMGKFSNGSEQATAGSALSTLLETHLRQSGIDSLGPNQPDAHYRIEGKIEQWTYLNGLVSRPAITLKINVHDARTDLLLWSSERNEIGKRRESLTLLADRLLRDLVKRMPMDDVDLPVTDSSDGMLVEVDYLKQLSAGESASNSQTASLASQLAMRSAMQWADDEGVSTDRPLIGRSTAFYHAAEPPIDILSQFDRLVLEPANVTADQLAQLAQSRTSVFAYLSIGELSSTGTYAEDVQEDWILGSHPTTGSPVLNLANMDLRAFLLSRVGGLHRAGYQGVFLDAMDSYQQVANATDVGADQQAGLVMLINSMAIRYPSMRIMVKRGFDVLDDIAVHVEAVAAESLFTTWNQETGRHELVPTEERNALKNRLDHARNSLGLDVIVMEYVAPHERDHARKIATRIARSGYIPWVATPTLDYVGIGALEVVPRKVLMLYDSQVDGELAFTPVHSLLAMPLEYLGYVPEYLDLAEQTLPSGELKGRYAGIVTWPTLQYKRSHLKNWLQDQLDSRVPVAFFNIPPVEIDATMAASMGIRVGKALDADGTSLIHMGDLFQPERSPPERYTDIGLVTQSISSANTTHMRFKDHIGQIAEPVVTGEFGGFAWQPGIVDVGLDRVAYWLLDPFRFIKTALQLPDIPQPDVTSENGKRFWLAHIEGGALPSGLAMRGTRSGAEAIHDRILERYPLPHTVSVDKADMSELPEPDARRDHLFSTMRKAFAMEHVDIALRTHRHLLDPARALQSVASDRHNLPVNKHRSGTEREKSDALDWLKQNLAPAGKEVELMVWSDDVVPSASELALAKELEIPTVHSVTTSLSRLKPSVSQVSPMALTAQGRVQVNAPVMNDRLYANDWQGPVDGYRKVIGTFEMTDKPRRLKPVNLNYQFDSGARTAAIKALEDVYAWSMTQDIYPIRFKDYALKVADFRRAGVARYMDGHWKISRLGQIRSLRLLSHNRWPQLPDSQGVTGARQLHDGLYLHTDGRDSVTFKTTRDAPSQVFLVSSNGQVTKWRQRNQSLVFQVIAEVPAMVELGGLSAGACHVLAGDEQVRGKATGAGTVIYSFKAKDTGNASLNCQA